MGLGWGRKKTGGALCSDAISEIDREMQDIYQGNEPQYHA